MPIKNRVGHRYGMLVVESLAGLNLRHQANWNCICDCGRNAIVFGGNLNNGHTISCGCHKGLWKHGENQIGKRSAEYQTLAGIISRCTNPNNVQYYNYGGRGITVCERWNSVSKIDNFVADVGRRPSPFHSIDRWPEKNGNYEPVNVRWATVMEQASNTRKNVYLTFQGETLHIAAMARRYGLTPAKLYGRIKSGWTLQQALLH
jgi:hypothetical protein